MKFLSLVVVSLFAVGCAGDDLGEAAFAVDTDGNGAVDCADLDHALACLHDPGSAACAHADVNGDGVVDDADIHDLYAGLAATHHDCTAPSHHDSDGNPVPAHH